MMKENRELSEMNIKTQIETAILLNVELREIHNKLSQRLEEALEYSDSLLAHANRVEVHANIIQEKLKHIENTYESSISWKATEPFRIVIGLGKRIIGRVL